jgi:hypothetical protein
LEFKVECVIGRRWFLVDGRKARFGANAPFQTVHADFPHTAYRWPVGSQHYADSRTAEVCTG